MSLEHLCRVEEKKKKNQNGPTKTDNPDSFIWFFFPNSVRFGLEIKKANLSVQS